MIAVIADDFTGAAEIGGTALRYGLNARIQTDPTPVDVDVLIIATDTRSLDAVQAVEEIQKITKKLQELSPKLIFKKTDSVLRGNVYEELEAQMKVTGDTKALLGAANPHLGRVIKEGKYFINGVALNETGFSEDPHFPMHSNEVLSIIRRRGDFNVANAKAGNDLESNTITIGDVESLDDYSAWISQVDDKTTLAGSAGFFNALLSSLFTTSKTDSQIPEIGERRLILQGSKYPKGDEFVNLLSSLGYAFFNMPVEIYDGNDPRGEYLVKWEHAVVDALKSGNALVSMNHFGSQEEFLSNRLSSEIAKLTHGIVKRVKVDELLIEGGSTMADLLFEMGIASLKPVQEFAPGVIRMKPDGDFPFYITSKPGSYRWSDQILEIPQPK